MLQFIKNIGHLVYRIWFYILVALPILIFFPFLLLTTLTEKTYTQFFWLARNLWAKTILYGMGFIPKIQWNQNLNKNESYMLVANHTSMIDIMLMLYLSKNPFVFVGKKELAKIPLFGFFYKRVCILVDRDDPKSRTAVYRSVQNRLNNGLSICIFPEGGVPDETIMLDKFKDGAFRMAIAHNIPVVPISFLDCKKRFSWSFFSGEPGRLRVVVNEFIYTQILGSEDTSTLKEEVRAMILEDLI
ncbi:lysophospholipid acyltransferase family protein [Croceitalea rosinachiae]|uniref:Lysophospholipid acyltransferase family protein n=1 Tax=Croceitalea rosinachiae TaxID=3075596 RepID=A0ABU3A8Q5_9FLAO|nr:lysophospholipid acyltransferase family protein [Croceitalea sp. F388]MDT0606185.1 lysophospholipid acyltransferase family protein [Croceitalea sp. F388]